MDNNLSQIIETLPNDEFQLNNISNYLITSYRGDVLFNLLIAEFIKFNDPNIKMSILNLLTIILNNTYSIDEEYKNGFALNIDILTNYVSITNNQNIYNYYLNFLENLYSKFIFSIEFLKKYIKIIQDKSEDLENKIKVKNEKDLKFKSDIDRLLNNCNTKSILDQRIEHIKLKKMYEKLLKEYNQTKAKTISLKDKEKNLKEIKDKILIYQTKIFNQISNNINMIKKLE